MFPHFSGGGGGALMSPRLRGCAARIDELESGSSIRNNDHSTKHVGSTSLIFFHL